MARTALTFLARLGMAALAFASLRLLLELRPPTMDEAWPLRWLRKVGEHPLRTSLALALLACAFGQGAARREEADPPAPPFPGP